MEWPVILNELQDPVQVPYSPGAKLWTSLIRVASAVKELLGLRICAVQ